MTLSILAVLGVTASIVVLKLVVFAFIVALAAKTLIPNYTPPKGSAVMARLQLHSTANKH